MRPDHLWDDVVCVLNSMDGQKWNIERLRRAVKRLVAEGIVEARVFERAAIGPDARSRPA
jgi:hypothetical protein